MSTVFNSFGCSNPFGGGETGVDLTFYLRVATSFNLPGAVINDDQAVPSGVWTQITIPIETTVPPCLEETVPCAQSFATVGNLQLGANALAGRRRG